MNNVKLLHITCCFFQFFNSPVALKKLKKISSPKKKLKWRPCIWAWLCRYVIYCEVVNMSLETMSLTEESTLNDKFVFSSLVAIYLTL